MKIPFLSKYRRAKKKASLNKKQLALAMEKTGLDKKAAEKLFAAAKEQSNIPLEDYLYFKLYEIDPADAEAEYRNRKAIVEEKAKQARKHFIEQSIIESKTRPAAQHAAEVYKTDQLKYHGSSPQKQPVPVIASCYYLGTPLPSTARGSYQPSAYVEALSGGIAEIRKRLGESLVPAIHEYDHEFSLFRKKFLSMNQLCFTETDLLIFYTDYLIHCKDYGYKYSDYFDFDFFINDFDIRNTFMSTSVYRQYAKQVCNKSVKLFKDKAKFNRKFSEVIHRDWLDMTDASFDDFQDFVSRHPVFFAKPILGSRGKGAHTVDSRRQNLSKLYKEFRDEAYIIEELVIQHDAVSAFNPDSLNTVRIYVIYDINNIARFSGAFIRFGRLGSDVDNFHKGGMSAAADPETGIVITDAVNFKGEKFARHPDSKLEFKGFQIPEWKKVKETISQACAICADINRHTGWDIAITKEGETEIIEGNCMPDFDMLQAVDKVGKLPVYDKYLTPMAEANGIEPYRHGHPELDVSGMTIAPAH